MVSEIPSSHKDPQAILFSVRVFCDLGVYGYVISMAGSFHFRPNSFYAPTTRSTSIYLISIITPFSDGGSQPSLSSIAFTFHPPLTIFEQNASQVDHTTQHPNFSSKSLRPHFIVHLILLLSMKIKPEVKLECKESTTGKCSKI